ncbi:cytochrome P450 [Lichtheimia hyalospora FSU 10163]|nr:cytochrome P450 [Lichtheimia hyalospora FSU 10163]
MPILTSNMWTTVDRHHQQVAVAVGATTAVFVAAYALRNLISSKRAPVIKEIPTPKQSYPYVGHLLSLGSMPGHKLTEWQKELGPIIQIKMGVQRWIIVDDPQIAHEIFVSNGAIGSGRPFGSYIYQVYALGGKGIVFANPTKSWRNTRKAALTVLAPKMVDAFNDMIEYEADTLLERLVSASKEDGGIHPFKTLQLASLNVILSTCFARRADSVDDPLFRDIVQYVDEHVSFAGLENDLPAFLPIFHWLEKFGSQARNKQQKSNRLLETRNRLFRYLVQQARKSDQNCFVKTLDDIKEEHGLDDDDIMVIMSDLVIAGTDTTSVTLAWLFVILVNHPHVQTQIQQEIDTFKAQHDGHLPSFSQVTQMPYTLSVMKEGLRFRPPTSFGMAHVMEQDLICRDYLIPKGTAVICNMHGIHFNPNVYSEPEKFIPERFMHNTSTMAALSNGKLEHRDQYNFGWGRRLCPGTYLSEVEMFAVLVRIFDKYNIEAGLDSDGKPQCVDMDKYVNAGIVVVPAPYKIRFTPRKQQ